LTRPARPVLLVWLLLAAILVSLLLRAWLAPPRGTAFVGTFYYVDDFFNYLGFVEQAQRGELVFRSKLAPASLPATFVNLEWLLVGWLAALLGDRPILAYRLFGLLAVGGLVGSAHHWLARCGVAGDRRLAALLLVFGGGGVGGLSYALGWLPGEHALDLRTGAFPFVEALANPHFVAGTALLATALAAFAAGRRGLGAALGLALALVRPYDAALLAAVETGATLLLGTRGERVRRLSALACLAPALAYQAWLVSANPGFGAFASPLYAARAPSFPELLIALGPATLASLVAVTAWRAGDAAVRQHLSRLALWATAAALVVLLRPVSFSTQFMVGVGLPLLLLAAAGLASLDPRALGASVALLGTSSVVVVWLCMIPGPRTHPPLQWWLVAQALRRECRPGDLVLAPAEIGLYVGGLTPCWPFLSHAAAPDYEARARDVARFYDPRSAPAARAELLARTEPRYVVWPPGPPGDSFGPDQPYELARVVHAPTGTLGIWSRERGRRAPR